MGVRTHIPDAIAAARQRAALTLAAWCLGLWIGWSFPAEIRSAFAFIAAACFAATALALVPVGRLRSHVSSPTSPTSSTSPVPIHAASVGLLLAVVFAAAGWSTLRLRESPIAALSRIVAASSQPADPIVLRLTILDAPRLKHRENNRSTWITRARSRGMIDEHAITHPAHAIVWLLTTTTTPTTPTATTSAAHPWSAGDRVIARGTFRPVSGPRNPGEFDLTRWARDRGIEGSFFTPSLLSVRPDESASTAGEQVERIIRPVLGAVRARAEAVVSAATASSDASTAQLVRGLLLGEAPDTPLDGYRAYYRVGLAHILTISGFHLAVFAGAVLFAVRAFGDLGRAEPLIVAACVGLFLIIVPPNSPTIRAAVIVLVLLAASLAGRRYDRLTLLLWTALALLIVRPSEMWSLGFQLSFGLTAALIGLTARLQHRLFPPRLGRASLDRAPPRWAASWWRSSLAASLICWLVSAPWIVVQLGVVNPLALVTSLLVTPLISVLLWIGYAAIFLGMVLPGLAGGLGQLAARLAEWSGALVIGADDMVGASVRLPWVSPLWGLVATTILVLWLQKPRLRRGTMFLLALLTGTWLAIELAKSEALPAGVRMQVARLDIAGGLQRSALVRTAESTTLIGTGGLRVSTLAAVTRELGAARLDTMVLDEPLSPAVHEIIAWLRPPRVVLVGPPGAPIQTPRGVHLEHAPSLAAALQNLGLAPAQQHLARSAAAGVQIVDLPIVPTPTPIPQPHR